MYKKIVLAMFVAAFFLFPTFSFARENVTDWYIKEFDSQIIVNKDSSLDITETITADNGEAIGKHGIFRILPTGYNVDGKKIKAPVELISITDENGQKYKYQTIKNLRNGTVTWKIGDPNKTVRGVNVYIIHYKIKNAIRFGNPNFDELNWNLNGNFWELETDKFHAAIKFPIEINKDNSTVDYYTGSLGSKEKNLATFNWSAPNVLEFYSKGTLQQKEGITVSVAFPKNIVAPYMPSFLESYGKYMFFLIPLLIFASSFFVWWKYGKDPTVKKTVIAEYSVPENLSPIELGMLMRSGNFNNSFITAEIIYFATRGIIVIEEVERKILFLSKKDYKLIKKENPQAEGLLNEAQKKLLKSIFEEGNKIYLSSLKTTFYNHTREVQKSARELLRNKGLIVTPGLTIGTVMFVVGIMSIFLSFGSLFLSFYLGLSLILSSITLIVFGLIMPKRTLAGAELNWKIEGFKLFMETVDKDRAEFYEKENIFDKLLPYAMVFGITKIWIEKMQEIYGKEYYATHPPIWYSGGMSTFDANTFETTMNNLSSQISANTSSSGSGGSGGGGGGGGGGGW